MAKWEGSKADNAHDKRMGWKEGSKADMAHDAKMQSKMDSAKSESSGARKGTWSANIKPQKGL